MGLNVDGEEYYLIVVLSGKFKLDTCTLDNLINILKPMYKKCITISADENQVKAY